MRDRSMQGTGFAGLLAVAAHLALAGFTAGAQTQSPGANDFGDIFAHPRDRSYLPGHAPSRATLDSTSQIEDSRGTVNRYEYSTGKSIITRETWVDERGETQGHFGIGIRF